MVDVSQSIQLIQQESDKINIISYNQEQTLVALGTNLGFYIYQLDPFILMTKQQYISDIRLIYIVSNKENSNQSDSVLLVSNKVQKDKNSNKDINIAILWNFVQQKQIQEYKCLEQINAISSNKNIIIIVQSLHIQCFSLDNELIYSIDTIYNKQGIYDLSFGSDFCIAAPHISLGNIIVHWFNIVSQPDQCKCYSKIVIQANKSGLSQLSVNFQGNMVATTSSNGTIIRIFDTKTAVKLKEFRRGSTPTNIYNLYFDLNTDFLVCYSERQTIHIYKIKTTNTNSYFKVLSQLLPLVGDEWSFAQFQLEITNQLYSIKTIIKNQLLYVFGSNDTYYMIQLTQNGGSLKTVQKSNLLIFT